MLVCRMMVRSRGLWAALAVAGLLFYGGCGPGGYSGPTGTVSGTVTLQGQPVPQGCKVAFVSDEGFTASGQVTAGGNYQLSVAGKGQNVPVATYKVCVSPPEGAEASEADYEKMMEESAGGEEGAAETPAQEEVIPAKYQTTTTSGLSFAVEEGANTIDITLE